MLLSIDKQNSSNHFFILSLSLSLKLFSDPVIPWYYYVPDENIDTEKARPGSTIRRPSVEGKGFKNLTESEGVTLYMWNQAMFVIAQLLTAGLLHINELDPIRRYLPSYNRPRRAGRYSAFQVIKHIINLSNH